jgi:hypothetical protein
MRSLKCGYARVSTSEQDHAGRVAALNSAGAVKIFSEKISGVRTDRPQLSRAIAALDQGDVLAVVGIDRLARSSRDLFNIVHPHLRQAQYGAFLQTRCPADIVRRMVRFAGGGVLVKKVGFVWKFIGPEVLLTSR